MASYGGFSDGEWRVDKEVFVKRLGEGAVARHQKSEYEQGGEDEPDPDTADLVGKLEAKNRPELHGATSGCGCAGLAPREPLRVEGRWPMWPAIVLK